MTKRNQQWGNHELGALVLKKRTEKKWSMRELASKSKITYATVEHVENGHTMPRVGTLMRIFRALGIKASVLDTMTWN